MRTRQFISGVLFVLLTGVLLSIAQTSNDVRTSKRVTKIVLHQKGKLVPIEADVKLLEIVEMLAFPSGVTQESYYRTTRDEILVKATNGAVLEVQYPVAETRKLVGELDGTRTVVFKQLLLPIVWTRSLDGQTFFSRTIFVGVVNNLSDKRSAPQIIGISGNGRGVDSFRLAKSKELKEALAAIGIDL